MPPHRPPPTRSRCKKRARLFRQNLFWFCCGAVTGGPLGAPPISNEFSALPPFPFWPPRFGALVFRRITRTKWSCEISGCGFQSARIVFNKGGGVRCGGRIRERCRLETGRLGWFLRNTRSVWKRPSVEGEGVESCRCYG